MGAGMDPLTLADSTTGNTIDVPDIQKDVTYHFRVRGVDAQSNQSTYSNEVSYLYENGEPTEVSLIGPADGTVSDAAFVELSWTGADDPDGDELTYTVHIFDEAGETTIEGITDTVYLYGGSAVTPSAEFEWTVSVADHEFTTASPDTFSVRSSRAGFGVPAATGLHQNFPNPFNPGTTIRYDVARNGQVTITIFNVLGQKVRTLLDQARPAGYWSIDWDGRDNRGAAAASGVYFCKLETPGFTSARKMTLVR
jgi:hypothetical protein